MYEWNMKAVRKLFTHIFLLLAGAIVLYWLLHETDRVKVVVGAITGVISPFAIGAAIAFVINVPMRAIEKQLGGVKNASLRRLIAVVLTILAGLLVLALVFWLLIPQLTSTVESLIPKLVDFALRVEESVEQFLMTNPELMEWVVNNTGWETFDWQSLVQKAATMVGNGISSILSGAFSALGTLARGVVNAVIAIVFAVYCLFQKETLARQGRKLLYAFLPELYADRIVRTFRLTNATFSNFLSGQCVEVCILGSLFAISMAIFRMPYIPLVSVLVAVTAFIPVVGAWTGCILGAFFILVDDPMLAVWFVVMFLIIQQVENNMIYPRVVGTSIGLSGMWVLMAVTLGGAFMGVAGMFLMIPVASVLYTLLREATNKKLSNMEIDPDKLVAHPPELQSKFKEKRQAGKKGTIKSILQKTFRKNK